MASCWSRFETLKQIQAQVLRSPRPWIGQGRCRSRAGVPGCSVGIDGCRQRNNAAPETIGQGTDRPGISPGPTQMEQRQPHQLPHKRWETSANRLRSCETHVAKWLSIKSTQPEGRVSKTGTACCGGHVRGFGGVFGFGVVFVLLVFFLLVRAMERPQALRGRGFDRLLTTALRRDFGSRPVLPVHHARDAAASSSLIRAAVSLGRARQLSAASSTSRSPAPSPDSSVNSDLPLLFLPDAPIGRGQRCRRAHTTCGHCSYCSSGCSPAPSSRCESA